MAEACGSCNRSFLRNRKINESLKCACGRPFFSQTVARNNVPSDRDCWIEVPKRFVRHYSSLFGETVSFEGDGGRSYPCRLVGSDIAIVGYGFEWHDFASTHDVCLGDQVVFTLMEKSRFLVQVYRAHVKVKVEPDVDVQVAVAQDWLLAKARRSGTNTDVDSMPSEGLVYTKRNEKVRKGSENVTSTSSPTQPEVTKERLEDAETEDAEASSSSTSDSDYQKQKNSVEDDDSGATSTSDDNMTEEEELRNSSRVRRGFLPSRSRPVPRSKRGKTVDGNISDGAGKRTRSPVLYVAPRVNKVHHWAEPGTTIKKTYVSKRGPVTRDDRDKVFEAAKACPITNNSYLRQLEKDNCYRALILAIPAPWWRENMPQTNNSYLGALVDEEGNSWQVRIRGTEIFWGNFTLDHYLEEDDVVVMELIDPRLKSLKFLVHIFRVVDVRVTLTGKAGWAVHYDVVEGIKKRKQEARSKGKGRLKRKHGRGSSHLKSPNVADLTTETSRKRVTRRQRNETVPENFGEDDSEDSLPLKHVRHSDDEDPIPPEIDDYTKFDKTTPEDVKVELMEVKMEYARESSDGGLIPSKTTQVLPKKVKLEAAL